MTKQRYDEHSTEFGIWTRQQDDLESRCGYIATNLDFIWTNYKTGQWMLLEEKRYGAKCRFPQTLQFETLHKSISSDKYCGFHFVQFEKTTPDDGNVFVNGVELNRQQFIKFLQFDEMAITYFTNDKKYNFK